MVLETKQFKQWLEHHQISKRTIEGWWHVLENLKQDDPDSFLEHFGKGFNEQLMSITFEKVGLYLSDWLVEQNLYVACYATIIYQEKDFGRYKMVFDIAGQVIDDYWVE
ncbi:MAG: hypothetical protein K0Q73_6428 [Paenibacillus sp.]|nr:hypothetical protein [Paenibacillus sp.]